MRIALVAHYYPPHLGGLEIVAQKQATSIAQRGHDVEVLTCVTTGGHLPAIADTPVAVHRLPAIDLTDQRFGIPFPFVGPTGVRTMEKVIRASDIVHIHDVFYSTSWIAAALAFQCRKPIVLTQHVAMVARSSPVVAGLQKLAYVTAGQVIFGKASRILVYNTNVHDFLIARGVRHEAIIHHRNGVDVRHFTPVEDEASKVRLRTRYGFPLHVPIALFVGRFVPKKGLDVLFNARSPHFHTIFVGNGKVSDSMRNDPHATFVGPFPYAEMRDLYQLSDLFVFPAVGEIFTLAMQEAMSCGLPIITSDDPGYRKYHVDRERIVFADPTPESLRRHILRVLADNPLRRAMSRYSITLAHAWFDWDSNVVTLFDIYERIAGR